MRPTIVGTSLMFLALYSAGAQNAAAPVVFDVVSIKPAAPQPDGMIRRMISGGPGSTDPGRLNWSNVSLKMMIVKAYGLKDYQVQGPDWLDAAGFDVVAKLPAGATNEQLQLMLQAMLAERFNLKVHHETKEMPVFALVVAKSGSKLKEVKVPDAPTPSAPPPDAVMRPGRDGGPAPMKSGPGMRMRMGPNGVDMAGYVTMPQLCDMLTRQLDRPVLDETALRATYDLNITFMPDPMSGGAPKGMMPPPGPGPGVTGDGPRNANEPTMTLAQALQETLGLKLEPRKSSADLLIVDRADKVPVEN